MGVKGDLGIAGNPGPAGPTGPLGEKGAKGEAGKSISAPSLLQRPAKKTTNESQTAIFKCTVDGNPLPQVTWSKLNSSLPVGRHVVQSSGALIVKDVRPDDEGVYSCTAKNLLGSVNASAKLIVQCKLFSFQFLLSSFMPVLPGSSSRSHILLLDSGIFRFVFVFLFLFCFVVFFCFVFFLCFVCFLTLPNKRSDKDFAIPDSLSEKKTNGCRPLRLMSTLTLDSFKQYQKPVKNAFVCSL